MSGHHQALAVTQEFGSTSSSLAVVETASAAVAAQSKAMVEARYIMAMQRPRNWDQVRQDLIKECRRPSFAHNKSAFYRKRDSITSFLGGKCTQCGTVQFPKSNVCVNPNCQAINTQVDHPFADLEAAVQSGSTMVRVGTAIFGQR